MPRQNKSQQKIDKAFSEVHEHIPRTVKATGKTGAAKEKMLTAIALEKSRAAGADVPAKPSKKRSSKASY